MPHLSHKGSAVDQISRPMISSPVASASLPLAVAAAAVAAEVVVVVRQPRPVAMPVVPQRWRFPQQGLGWWSVLSDYIGYSDSPLDILPFDVFGMKGLHVDESPKMIFKTHPGREEGRGGRGGRRYGVRPFRLSSQPNTSQCGWELHQKTASRLKFVNFALLHC